MKTFRWRFTIRNKTLIEAVLGVVVSAAEKYCKRIFLRFCHRRSISAAGEPMARVPKVARETISLGTPRLRYSLRNTGWIINFQKIAVNFRQWSFTKFQNSFKTFKEQQLQVYTKYIVWELTVGGYRQLAVAQFIAMPIHYSHWNVNVNYYGKIILFIYLFISSNTHTYNTFVGEHWVVEMIMHWWGIKGPKDANIIPIWCQK